MKEPVSLDLFPSDVCPLSRQSEFIRFARERFLYQLNRRSRFNYPPGGCAYMDVNNKLGILLRRLGGLGGVW